MYGWDNEWDGPFWLCCLVAPDDSVQVFHDRPSTIAALKALPPDAVLAAHFGRNDAKSLGWYSDRPMFDTGTLAFLVDENQMLGLDDVAKLYLRRKLVKPLKRDEGEVWWTGLNGDVRMKLRDAPLDEVTLYCTSDARATRDLCLALWPRMSGAERFWYRQTEAPLDRILFDMEARGIGMDLDLLVQETEALAAERDRVEQEIYGLLGYGLNLNSGDQLARMLFEPVFCKNERQQVGFYKNGKPKFGQVTIKHPGLNLTPPGKWTPSGKRWATDAETLDMYEGDHPVTDKLLEYRQIDKVLGTYLLAFPRFMVGDRLFGRLNAVGTKTGRFSSREPNLQNVPKRGPLGKRVRHLFVAKPGHKLVIADQDQVELRRMAAYAGCKFYIDVFDRGGDPHQDMADFLTNLLQQEIIRDPAKTLNYSIGYGIGMKKLARKLGVDLDTARGIIGAFYNAIPEIVAWKEELIEECRQAGYITTDGGRKRRLPDITSWDGFDRSRAERQAVSSKVQGSCADITKRWIIEVARRGIPLLLQVHDEIIAEVPETSAEWSAAEIEDALQVAVRDCGGPWSVAITTTAKPANRWSEK